MKMTNFKLFLLFSLLCAIVSIESATVCPEDISPCKCYNASQTNLHSQVRCGDSSNQLNSTSLTTSLDKLDGEFGILYIHNTDIDKIVKGTLKKAKFNKIFIENNTKLAEIELDAFDVNVQPVSLVIRNNSIFTGHNIFDLAKKHGQKLVILELDQNAIGNIPQNALNANKSTLQNVEVIRLDNQKGTNKMTSIGESAFANLPKLLTLSLDHNAIANIGDKNKLGIDLSMINNLTQHVSIFLNNNQLKPDVITEERIKLPTQGSVGLVLQDNSISIDLAISKKLFQDIASNPGGKVYLHNAIAPPTCNCEQIPDLIKNIIKNKDEKINQNLRGIDNCKKGQSSVKISEC